MSLLPNVSGRSRVRLAKSGVAVFAAAVVAGCGSSYRPVITPINPTGPAAQPISYAIAVSSPSVSAPGVASVIDYAGDTVMVQAPIGPNPFAFTLDSNGS